MTWTGLNSIASTWAKNVLNIFRRDNGYKAGTYQKSWQGREDNEHLVSVIHQLDASNPALQGTDARGPGRQLRGPQDLASVSQYPHRDAENG